MLYVGTISDNIPLNSNYVMNEMPTKLASHPRLGDAPELALLEAFEQVDKALGDAAKENEQVYR